jgi:hypothetical protein
MHTIQAGLFARNARAAWSRLSAVLDITDEADDWYPQVERRTPLLSIRAPLTPGHFLVLQTIYLPVAFPCAVIPVAASFDILAIEGDRARIHFAESREWVSCSILQGRALSITDKIVGDDGFTMVAASEAG